MIGNVSKKYICIYLSGHDEEFTESCLLPCVSCLWPMAWNSVVLAYQWLSLSPRAEEKEIAHVKPNRSIWFEPILTPSLLEYSLVKRRKNQYLPGHSLNCLYT